MYMYSTRVETSPGQLDQGAGQAIPIVVLTIFWSGGHTMVYVVQVVEIVIIELLRAAGVIAKLRSIGVLKPSKASTSAISTANLTQIATTSTATNPNPSGTQVAIDLCSYHLVPHICVDLISIVDNSCSLGEVLHLIECYQP